LAADEEAMATAAAVEAKANTSAHTEVVAAVIALTTANLAAAAGAAFAAKAAATAAAAETEAAKLEAVAKASAAEAGKRALQETKKPKTQQTGTGPSTRAAARAAGTGASTPPHFHSIPPSNTKNPGAPSRRPRKRTNNKTLRTGTSPTRMHYQKAQTSRATRPSWKTTLKMKPAQRRPKKTNTGKGKKGNPKTNE